MDNTGWNRYLVTKNGHQATADGLTSTVACERPLKPEIASREKTAITKGVGYAQENVSEALGFDWVRCES
ncbi:hypothetical protein P3T16_001485 [Paraburkholderia sp. GAS42]|jgi:hypothetical protein